VNVILLHFYYLVNDLLHLPKSDHQVFGVVKGIIDIFDKEI
jgi:hypothetical protein